ncbi:MAG: hypothetical protein LBE38_10595 [Deltaproteobacteria bacterium]|jgi:diacylglycerol kinase family enzyme|nr:hypothetical protein [Deltaproteobacteria bacterium]
MNFFNKKHVFIINPVSFKSKHDMDAFINELGEYFGANDSNLFVYISKFPRDAISAIRNYMSKIDNNERVAIYAVGGDGILFDCLNGVVGLSNIELGVIPYGNSNDFIRCFGDNALEHFRDIHSQLIGSNVVCDIIDAGNNYALNTCTIGLESYAVLKALDMHKSCKSVLEYMPKPISSFFYNLMYFFGGVLSLINDKVINQHYKVTIDGEDFSGNYSMINIANGHSYGGDKYGAVGAMPNDGFLDVLLFKSTSKFNLLNKGVEYLYGKFYKYPELISYHRAKQIEVRSNDPLLLQLDGEIFIDTNITFKIIPNTLNIVTVKNHQFTRNKKYNEACDSAIRYGKNPISDTFTT